MLQRDLDPKNPPQPELLALGLRLRCQAEEAALAIPADSLDKNYPYSERVYAWIEEKLGKSTKTEKAAVEEKRKVEAAAL